MLNLPLGVDINNLIDDLRIFSWEAADVLLDYAKIIRDGQQTREIVQNENYENPVTLADLKVNDLIINRIQQKYQNIQWKILSEENVKLYSNHPNPNSDWLWVLDPLDGTKDFIQGTGDYAMHLALNYKKKPYLGVVLLPEKNELWISNGKKCWCENRNGIIREISIASQKVLQDMVIVTSKNHRNDKLKELIDKINFKKIIVMGSIGCKIASIINGESDIYISLSMPGKSSPKDWDYAAPEAILKSAGGAITNIYNEDLTYGTNNFEHPGIVIASNDKENHHYICLKVKEIVEKYSIYHLNY